MIIRTNIFIMSILHPEASRNHAQLCETKPLIQMSGMNIAGNYRIKLQHTISMLSALNQTV